MANLYKRIVHYIKSKSLAGAFLERFWKTKPFVYFVNTSSYNKLYSKFIKKCIKSAKYPTYIALETTNACNAHCIMCPHDKMKRKIGFMSFELFKKIVDDAIKNRIPFKAIVLDAFGEPLLDPLLFKKIRYIKDNSNYMVAFSTNANLLNKEKAKKLLDSGLDILNISLNATTKSEYEKIMKGLDYNTTIKNIKNFIKEKEKRKLSEPRIIINTVVVNENKKNVKKFLNKWKKHAIASATMSENWGGSVDLKSPLKLVYKQKKWPCKRIWFDMYVFWDGKVSLCCRDYDGKQIIGDLKKQSIMQVWKGKKLKEMRKLHLKEEFDKINICKNCDFMVKSSTFWWRM